MGENNEDLLDVFAAMALMGLVPKGLTTEACTDAWRDNLSRSCYLQAQSMLRVRKEFAKD